MDAPTPPSSTIGALEQRRASILASISAIGDLRPGSVIEIHTKCGRPACHCQQEGDRGHGPYFRLVFYSDGKQTTRSLSAQKAETVRAEVAACQRLRRLTGELIEVSEQLSEARLPSADPATAQRSPQKKGIISLSNEKPGNYLFPVTSGISISVSEFDGPLPG